MRKEEGAETIAKEDVVWRRDFKQGDYIIKGSKKWLDEPSERWQGVSLGLIITSRRAVIQKGDYQGRPAFLGKGEVDDGSVMEQVPLGTDTVVSLENVRIETRKWKDVVYIQDTPGHWERIHRDIYTTEPGAVDRYYVEGTSHGEETMREAHLYHGDVIFRTRGKVEPRLTLGLSMLDLGNGQWGSTELVEAFTTAQLILQSPSGQPRPKEWSPDELTTFSNWTNRAIVRDSRWLVEVHPDHVTPSDYLASLAKQLDHDAFMISRKIGAGKNRFEILAVRQLGGSGPFWAKQWMCSVLATVMESVDAKAIEDMNLNAMKFIKDNKSHLAINYREPWIVITLIVAGDFGQKVKEFVVNNQGVMTGKDRGLCVLAATSERRLFFSNSPPGDAGAHAMREFIQMHLMFGNLGF